MKLTNLEVATLKEIIFKAAVEIEQLAVEAQIRAETVGNIDIFYKSAAYKKNLSDALYEAYTELTRKQEKASSRRFIDYDSIPF